MSSIEIPPKFKGYLKGLRKYNLFPNIFLYFVPDYGGEKPFAKAYDFGYHNDLILFNSGNYISAFISMLVIWLIFYILSKLTHLKPFSIPFLKKKIESSLQGYKYNAFIRFWITCYLDVFAAALIVFITTSLSVWASAINLVVAIGIAVRYKQIAVVATPGLFFYYTYKNRNKVKEEEDVSVSWGTLFYEFNNDKGLSSSMYYFYFFSRRILYMLIQFFIREWPIVQLTLNIVLSASVRIT